MTTACACSSSATGVRRRLRPTPSGQVELADAMVELPLPARRRAHEQAPPRSRSPDAPARRARRRRSKTRFAQDSPSQVSSHEVSRKLAVADSGTVARLFSGVQAPVRIAVAVETALPLVISGGIAVQDLAGVAHVEQVAAERVVPAHSAIPRGGEFHAASQKGQGTPVGQRADRAERSTTLPETRCPAGLPLRVVISASAATACRRPFEVPAIHWGEAHATACTGCTGHRRWRPAEKSFVGRRRVCARTKGETRTVSRPKVLQIVSPPWIADRAVERMADQQESSRCAATAGPVAARGHMPSATGVAQCVGCGFSSGLPPISASTRQYVAVRRDQ